MKEFWHDPIPEIEVSGTSRQMGRQTGEADRALIKELLKVRLEGCRHYADAHGIVSSEASILAVAASCLPELKSFDPEVWQEFEGIAEGAKVSLAELLFTQGYTDIRDQVAFWKGGDDGGCSSVALQSAKHIGVGPLMGQTWDLAGSNLPYVKLLRRRPVKGPETLSLTVVGGLSMIGMNAAGVAVGTTNLKTLDARPGVHYLATLHKCLAADTMEQALQVVKDVPCGGAHYFMLGHADGSIAGCERSPIRAAEMAVEEGMIIHCNHVLTDDLVDVELLPREASSLFRQRRLEALMQKREALGVECLKEIFGDEEGGSLAISRRGEGLDINTNACVIMQPEQGIMHACWGQADLGTWQTYTV